jgi:hypothetical protein
VEGLDRLEGRQGAALSGREPEILGLISELVGFGRRRSPEREASTRRSKIARDERQLPPKGHPVSSDLAQGTLQRRRSAPDPATLDVVAHSGKIGRRQDVPEERHRPNDRVGVRQAWSPWRNLVCKRPRASDGVKEVTVSQTTHPPQQAGSHAVEPTVTWLQQEFPGWSFDVSETVTWEGDARSLWIARREGHHPQAELSPAKLHTRLSDYLEREDRRGSLMN